MAELRRIQVNGAVSDVLIQALEEAGDFEHVLVLYQKKDGGEGFFHGGSASRSTLNWMLDSFKQWLLTHFDDD